MPFRLAYSPRRTARGATPAARTHLALLGAAVGLLAVARADEPPPLKEGLWQVRGQSIENPGHKITEFAYRLCRDHAYDKALDAVVKNTKECTTSFDSLGDGRYSAASRCTVGATTIESKGTYTYESSTAARSESFAKYTPPYKGKTEETIVQDQRYVGECPKGMKPGDRLLEDPSRPP